MESTKDSSYLTRTTQLQEESLKLPLLPGLSGGSSSSRCILSVSKVLPNLVVALLLLLSMGMLMYNTNCSFSVMVSSDSAPDSKSARYESISSTLAAEMRLHRRLRGIAQYLSISPAAPYQIQVQVQVQYDAAPPSALELLPKESIPDQVLPSIRSRGLALVEQREGESRWPNLGFEKKMHPMPNGPDPIHNRREAKFREECTGRSRQVPTVFCLPLCRLPLLYAVSFNGFLETL